MFENVKIGKWTRNPPPPLIDRVLRSIRISTCLSVLQYAFRAATEEHLVKISILFIQTYRSQRVLARSGDLTPLSCVARRALSSGGTRVAEFSRERRALMGPVDAGPLKS